MDFLFYFLVIFLAIISNFFITNILITFRVGISLCKEIYNSNDYDEHYKSSAQKLKKKYQLSLFVNSLIVFIIILIIIFLLKQYSSAYFIALAIFVLLSISKTGKNNPDNLGEFNNSLKAFCNYNDTNNMN